MKARAFAIAALFVTACHSHDDLPVATHVDLQQFQGQWYEIAHLPRPTQRDCAGTIATYKLRDDGNYDFVHECTLSDGSYYGKTLIASVPDTRTPAKLAVDIGGFKGDYWIVDVAPDYRYAVVGHPSRDYLWVLSRTPTMTPADHDAALARAKDTGFDTTKLEYTPAAPAPSSGTPAPPVTYGASGCAMGMRSRASGALFFVVAAAAFVLRRRAARRECRAPLRRSR